MADDGVYWHPFHAFRQKEDMVLSAVAAFLAASLGSDDVQAQPIFSDPTRSIEVRYRLAANGVEFSSLLPEGWAFSVSIDINQDGRWGNGAFNVNDLRPSLDRSFGQDADTDGLCVQAVMASTPGDPDSIYASTDCGTVPTRGSLSVASFDAQGRAMMTISIPNDELFGSSSSANLQVCVWDTQQRTCQHSPTRPFILTRPATELIAWTSANRSEQTAG